MEQPTDLIKYLESKMKGMDNFTFIFMLGAINSIREAFSRSPNDALYLDVLIERQRNGFQEIQSYKMLKAEMTRYFSENPLEEKKFDQLTIRLRGFTFQEVNSLYVPIDPSKGLNPHEAKVLQRFEELKKLEKDQLFQIEAMDDLSLTLKNIPEGTEAEVREYIEKMIDKSPLDENKKN